MRRFLGAGFFAVVIGLSYFSSLSLIASVQEKKNGLSLRRAYQRQSSGVLMSGPLSLPLAERTAPKPRLKSKRNSLRR